MSRALLLVVALLVSFGGLARAQVSDITSGRPDGTYFSYVTLPSSYERPITAEDIRQNEIEQKYRAVVNARIPDKKPSNDPWKTIRPTASAITVDRHRPQ